MKNQKLVFPYCEKALISCLLHKKGDFMAMSMISPMDFQDATYQKLATLIWQSSKKGKLNMPLFQQNAIQQGLHEKALDAMGEYEYGDPVVLAGAVIDEKLKGDQKEIYTAAITSLSTTKGIDVASRASNDLRKILSRGSTDGAKASELLAPPLLAEFIERMKNPDAEPTGQKTGIAELDSILGRIEDCDIVQVIARPSHFKTALTLILAIKAAEQGRKVVYFSFETTAERIMRRVFSYLSGYSADEIAQGHVNKKGLSEEQIEYDNTVFLQTMKHTAKIVAELPFSVYDGSGDFNNVRAEIIKHYQDGCNDFYLDYFQLMYWNEVEGNRTQELKQISQNLKVIQKDCGAKIRIVLACQASKVPDTEKRLPRPSEIEWCTGAEQDADKSICLMIPHKYTDDHDMKNKLLINVGKNKDGATGFTTMRIGKAFRLSKWNNDGLKDFDDVVVQNNTINLRAEIEDDVPF